MHCHIACVICILRRNTTLLLGNKDSPHSFGGQISQEDAILCLSLWVNSLHQIMQSYNRYHSSNYIQKCYKYITCLWWVSDTSSPYLPSIHPSTQPDEKPESNQPSPQRAVESKPTMMRRKPSERPPYSKRPSNLAPFPHSGWSRNVETVPKNPGVPDTWTMRHTGLSLTGSLIMVFWFFSIIPI